MSTDNPRGPTPPLYDSSLNESGNEETLLRSLEGDVDDLRQIATDLGARPYTYHSVKVQWSGGEVGRGEPSVISDIAILPTPQTSNVGAIDRTPESGGAAERGDIALTGVSPRFTEDEIDDLCGVSNDDGAVEVFIEQRIDQRDGSTRRRRFILAKAPERRPTRLDWKITLRKAWKQATIRCCTHSA